MRGQGYLELKQKHKRKEFETICGMQVVLEENGGSSIDIFLWLRENLNYVNMDKCWAKGSDSPKNSRKKHLFSVHIYLSNSLPINRKFYRQHPYQISNKTSNPWLMHPSEDQSYVESKTRDGTIPHKLTNSGKQI